MIQAACIVHNLLITSWVDTIAREELAKIMEREQRMQRRRRAIQVQHDVMESHMRRERLVDEMLEWEDEEVDLEGYVL